MEEEWGEKIGKGGEEKRSGRVGWAGENELEEEVERPGKKEGGKEA